MIENIPTEGLYDPEYEKIIDEMIKIREKQLDHNYELNILGTNSKSYSLIDLLSNPFRKNKKTRRYVIYALKKYATYLKKQKKIQISNIVDSVWTRDVIESSTLPYPVRRAEYPWAILKAELKENMRVLDVGSGISLFPLYLAKNHNVVSVDPDKILMNKLAPKLAEYAQVKLEYKIDDITKLNFNDDTFDRVFCISVIEHLEEEYIDGKFVNKHKENLDVKAISELLRVLKPGGLLIMTFDWNEDKNEFRSYKLDDIYDRILKPFRDNLLIDKKPIFNWEELKKKHLEAGKSFPPFNYITEGWAIGVILKK